MSFTLSPESPSLDLYVCVNFNVDVYKTHSASTMKINSRTYKRKFSKKSKREKKCRNNGHDHLLSEKDFDAMWITFFAIPNQ